MKQIPKKFHTVIVGGGCLGTASAISIARKIKKKKVAIQVLFA
jgi:thioredoxin reductase